MGTQLFHELHSALRASWHSDGDGSGADRLPPPLQAKLAPRQQPLIALVDKLVYLEDEMASCT